MFFRHHVKTTFCVLFREEACEKLRRYIHSTSKCKWVCFVFRSQRSVTFREKHRMRAGTCATCCTTRILDRSSVGFVVPISPLSALLREPPRANVPCLESGNFSCSLLSPPGRCAAPADRQASTAIGTLTASVLNHCPLPFPRRQDSPFFLSKVPSSPPLACQLLARLTFPLAVSARVRRGSWCWKSECPTSRPKRYIHIPAFPPPEGGFNPGVPQGERTGAGWCFAKGVQQYCQHLPRAHARTTTVPDDVFATVTELMVPRRGGLKLYTIITHAGST